MLPEPTVSTQARMLPVDDDAQSVAAVLVVYGTPPERLRATLRNLDGLMRVVVDNSEDPAARECLAEVCASEGASYEGMAGNAGVGAAQNRGVAVARRLGCRFVLLADDDTAVRADHVAELVRALSARAESDPNTAGIGPLLVDGRTEEAMYFVWRRDRVRFVRSRTNAQEEAREPFPAAFLIASGSLLRLDALTAIGDFRDDYFIDHIDREWGLRAGTLGWTLLVHPAVRVHHALGDEPLVDASGAATYRHDSPLRQYYGARNSLLLLTDVRLPPIRWGLEAAFAVYVVVTQWRAHGPDARRHIAAGVRDGLLRRRGPRAR